MPQIQYRRDQIKDLEKILANLSIDHAAATEQYSFSNDLVQKKQLLRKIESISTDMELHEQRLALLEKSQNSYRQVWNSWEDNLHDIDFDVAKKVTSTLLKKYEKKEGAALFFMHNSQKMGGRWYIKFIKSQLQNLPYSSWAEPFEYRSESHPGGDSIVFLNRLSNKFIPEINTTDELGQINKIVEAIYNSLPRGHVLFISISIEQIRPQDTFLEWFINQFWVEVVRKLSEVTNSHPLIRIIGIISVEGKVDKKHMPIHLCAPLKQFDQHKMLELKLKPWTKSQICTWLEAYSNLDPSDIPGKAQTIYEITESGVPLRVYDKLVTTIQIEAS
jgi:inactive STAND